MGGKRQTTVGTHTALSHNFLVRRLIPILIWRRRGFKVNPFPGLFHQDYNPAHTGLTSLDPELHHADWQAATNDDLEVTRSYVAGRKRQSEVDETFLNAGLFTYPVIRADILTHRQLMFLLVKTKHGSKLCWFMAYTSKRTFAPEVQPPNSTASILRSVGLQRRLGCPGHGIRPATSVHRAALTGLSPIASPGSVHPAYPTQSDSSSSPSPLISDDYDGGGKELPPRSALSCPPGLPTPAHSLMFAETLVHKWFRFRSIEVILISMNLTSRTTARVTTCRWLRPSGIDADFPPPGPNDVTLLVELPELIVVDWPARLRSP
ncbi:hypothetical protein FPV67DRAFT_1456684 [Lyophyllum atratum]|nr:hypothetical protein FPV67DRAFT_1456684 [Lyophyllum atratum]